MPGTPLETRKRALQDAIRHLKEWIEAGNYDSPPPLLEAMSAVKRLENVLVGRIGDGYWAARESTGAVVAGIVYARNLADHQQPAVVEDVKGRRPFTVGRSRLRGGDVLRGRGVRVVWRPLADLPTPDRFGRDESYKTSVAGRSVIDTLEEAVQFFDSF